MKRLSILFLLLFGTIILRAQSITDRVKYMLDTTFAAHPAATGIMVSICSSQASVPWTYAVGVGDKGLGTKLRITQPVLTASNTKTYISATILRLAEQKKLSITDPIGKHLSAKTAKKLTGDGYDLQKITITHLLSHTSGIDDYVNDDYLDFVNKNRRYAWTRDEQIDRAVAVGKPLAQPGDTFKYADVNYLLLTDIIESITHKPFYTSVREQLKYKNLDLRHTWFVNLEPKPSGADSLAHQYWKKYPWDSYDLNPSWDLYGGGGIVATPADMALFFSHLFEGRIIKDTAVLAKMYTEVKAKTPTNYCLGLRKIRMGGLTGYYHGGFWGTDIIYFPDLKTSISIVILEKGERDLSAKICEQVVEIVKSETSKQ